MVMKKSTIWTIAIVIGISFITLLFLQTKYLKEVINMRKEQFDESVTRSLYQTARNLELEETKQGLEEQFHQHASGMPDSLDMAHPHAVRKPTPHTSIPVNVTKGIFLDNLNANSVSESVRDSVRKRFINQKALLNEVVYSILYKASDKPLAERIDFRNSTVTCELSCEATVSTSTITFM